MSHDFTIAQWAPPSPDRYGRFRVLLTSLMKFGRHDRFLIRIESSSGVVSRLAQVQSIEELMHLIEGMRAEQWPEHIQ